MRPTLRHSLPHTTPPCPLSLSVPCTMSIARPPRTQARRRHAPGGSDEANSALANAYMNAFATADDKVFDEILSTDYKHHFGIGEDAQSPAALKQKVAERRKAFNGGGFDIEQVIVGGDMVVGAGSARERRSARSVASGRRRWRPPIPASTSSASSATRSPESWNESDHLGRLQAAGVLTNVTLSAPRPSSGGASRSGQRPVGLAAYWFSSCWQ